MATKEVSVKGGKKAFTAAELPPLNLQQLLTLTDQTGIIQHAVFSMPNRKEGYCIDDNSRALLFSVWAYKLKKDPVILQLIPTYLSFIHYMQLQDGYFRNFLAYDKSWMEERGSEDSFGRTLMALGFLANEGPSHLLIKTGLEIFTKAYPYVRKLESPRGIAQAIVGICQYIKCHFPDDIKRDMVIELTDKLVHHYHQNKKEDWKWFEPILTYDNAILPLALLNAYEITQDENYLNIAFESMAFLESVVFCNGIFRPVGNRGWYPYKGKPAQFDQQGVDAMAMIIYYQQAFRVTREQEHLDKMFQCFRWFLGSNDLGVSLYDPATGGCADGLHISSKNQNQGAESTLSYLISRAVVATALTE